MDPDKFTKELLKKSVDLFRDQTEGIHEGIRLIFNVAACSRPEEYKYLWYNLLVRHLLYPGEDETKSYLN